VRGISFYMDQAKKQIKLYKEKIKAFEKKIKALQGAASTPPEINALNKKISEKKPDPDLLNAVKSGLAAKGNRKKQIRTAI